MDRELRRKAPAGAGSKREPSARPPRASAPTHMSVENMSSHTAGGRRSPRLGNFGAGRLPRAPAATRMGFGQDITNMDRCRANIAGKPAKMSSLQSSSVPQVVPSSLRSVAHTLPRPAADQEGHKSVPIPPPTISVSIASAISPASPRDGISVWEESSNVQHVGEYA